MMNMQAIYNISICEQFLKKETGMKISIFDFLEQWYELVAYVKKTLSLTRVSYLLTWRKIFTAPKCKG